MFTNIVNNKKYIGISNDIHKRVRSHIRGQGSKLLYRAIRKHGIENFRIDVLEGDLTPSKAKRLEVYFIELFDCFNPRGYNSTLGGDGVFGFIPSEETLKKRSKSLKGRTSWIKGKKHKEVSKRKVSEALKGNKNSLGFKQTQEHVKKRSEAMKGKKCSPSHIEKVRQSKLGDNNPMKNPLVAKKSSISRIVNNIARNQGVSLEIVEPVKVLLYKL